VRYTTASQIEKAVRTLYQKNGCVVLSEVRNGTGFERRQPRTADLLIVSTWPSRGLYCEGVEIKVSRSDLQKELEHPEKAESIARYCRRWWLAVPDDLDLSCFMVPEGWGIITVDEKGKPRSRGGMDLGAQPMDTLMVCAALRNFAESHVHVSEIAPKVQEATEKAVAQCRDRSQQRVKELEEAIEQFKEYSGINILGKYGRASYELKEIGEAVTLLVNLRHHPIEKITRISEELKSAGAAVEAALAVLSRPDTTT
jgi:hypothetical protein